MRLSLVIAVAAMVACSSQRPPGSARSAENAAGHQTRSADTLQADATIAESLVGRSHPPLPSGYATVAGMVLGDARTSHFAMAQLVHNDVHILTLDSLTQRDVTGKPHWVVLDALVLPRLRANEEVTLLDCSLDGNADASIVAIGTWAGQTLTGLRYATRPDVSGRRFKLLPPDRVSCSYEEDRI